MTPPNPPPRWYDRRFWLSYILLLGQLTFTGEELRYPKVHYLGTAQEITSDWNLTYHVFEVLG